MVEIIQGTVYSGDSSENLLLAKELCEALVDNCNLTVVGEEDTALKYSATLLYPDGFRAIQITMENTEGGTTSAYTVSDGYYSEEVYHSSYTYTSTIYNANTSTPTREFALYVVNEGCCFYFKVSGATRGSGAYQGYRHTSSLEIISESSIKYYAIAYSDSYAMLSHYTVHPYIISPEQRYALQYPADQGNLNFGRIAEDNNTIAFPWIFFVQANDITLGVPTIGGKKVYKILYRPSSPGTSVGVFEEVTIGDKRFVCLGQNFIIESD